MTEQLTDVIRKATIPDKEFRPEEIRYAALEEAVAQAVAYLACMMQEGVTDPIDCKYIHKILLRAGDDNGGSRILNELDKAYDKADEAELRCYQMRRRLRNQKHFWRWKINKQNKQILELVAKLKQLQPAQESAAGGENER